jgi:hypothetical protein
LRYIHWFEEHSYITALIFMGAVFLIAVAGAVALAALSLLKEILPPLILRRCSQCVREGKIW